MFVLGTPPQALNATTSDTRQPVLTGCAGHIGEGQPFSMWRWNTTAGLARVLVASPVRRALTLTGARQE